jgi:TPP-dependent pyruvate/acetoin dehydrogenase alpha subunit
MLRIRMVEEAIAERYPDQEMRCPVHLSIGQEAVPVGVAAAFSVKDLFYSNHRSHGHYLAKGGNLNRMIAEIYGKETGCCQGRGGSMHLIDISCGFMGSVPIVGSIIPIATGAALTFHLMKDARMVVVFLGDGAVEEGVFYETLNFALLHNLRILYICENNNYSSYSPLSVRQPSGREIISLAQGVGVRSIHGYGNDVEGVYQITKQAVEFIQNEELPVFIELKTYRWREHCGPFYDNHIGYRSVSEFEKWKDQCPIESYFQNKVKGIISDSDLDRMKIQIQNEIEDAFRFAQMSPYPSKEDLSDEVYA